MENTSGSRYKSTLKCGLILPFSLKEYETSPIVQFLYPIQTGVELQVTQTIS